MVLRARALLFAGAILGLCVGPAIADRCKAGCGQRTEQITWQHETWPWCDTCKEGCVGAPDCNQACGTGPYSYKSELTEEGDYTYAECDKTVQQVMCGPGIMKPHHFVRMWTYGCRAKECCAGGPTCLPETYETGHALIETEMDWECVCGPVHP